MSSPPRPLRILIQTSCYCVIDGVTSTIRKLESHLLQSDPLCEICILTTRSGDLRNVDKYLESIPLELHAEVLKRRSIIFVEALKLPVMEIYEYQLGLRLNASARNAIKKFNPSIIHSTVPDLLNLDLLTYAHTTQTRYIATFHSDYILYMDYYEASWIKIILENYMRHTYSFTPELYVPTEYYRRLLRSPDYNLKECVEVKMWGRPVDLRKFNREHRSEEWRKKMGFNIDDVVVCYCGRLVVEKNPERYIQVMEKLKGRDNNNNNVKGLVIGDGPYLKIIQERLEKDYVKCTGWLGQPELSVAYASSDIFLFPSGCETFGNVTLEACASGLPVIVEGGCSEHLVENNGYAITKQEEYYMRTLEIIEDKELRKRMAENSVKVSKQFDMETVCDKMVKIYENAKPPKNDAPDNIFNFPWGRDAHPWALVGVEVVFWILCTSWVQLTKLYEYSKRTPVLNVVVVLILRLFGLLQFGVNRLMSKKKEKEGGGGGSGEGGITERVGGMLGLAFCKFLARKPVQPKVT